MLISCVQRCLRSYTKQMQRTPRLLTTWGPYQTMSHIAVESTWCHRRLKLGDCLNQSQLVAEIKHGQLIREMSDYKVLNNWETAHFSILAYILNHRSFKRPLDTDWSYIVLLLKHQKIVLCATKFLPIVKWTVYCDCITRNPNPGTFENMNRFFLKSYYLGT